MNVFCLQAARAGRFVLLSVSVPMLLAACSAEPRWRAIDAPVERDAARLFRPEGAYGAPRDPYAGEITEVPMRRNLRPCCAFGAQLQVRVGPVPIPWYFMGNLVDRRSIKHHAYDNGLATLGSRGSGPTLVHSEGNGLVYSCRAGFLDIAHIRDYADSTVHMITSLVRLLETGGSIALPEEGAVVRVRVRPVDPAALSRYGHWQIAIPLGQWLAFQASVWHEIATWYGWSTFPLFPEKVSAFSPEDLYSNMLGVRVGAAVVSQRGARDEFTYNRNVDRWLDRALAVVETVPVATAEEAMLALDGLWWDSSKRVPDDALLLRRSFEAGEVVRPWLVPPGQQGPRLRAVCGEEPRPLPIANPASVNGIDFAQVASLVVELPDDLAAREPFVRLRRRLTQQDFPAILEHIREEARTMYGPLADRPDIEDVRPVRAGDEVLPAG